MRSGGGGLVAAAPVLQDPLRGRARRASGDVHNSRRHGRRGDRRSHRHWRSNNRRGRGRLEAARVRALGSRRGRRRAHRLQRDRLRRRRHAKWWGPNRSQHAARDRRRSDRRVAPPPSVHYRVLSPWPIHLLRDRRRRQALRGDARTQRVAGLVGPHQWRVRRRRRLPVSRRRRRHVGRWCAGSTGCRGPVP